MERGESFDGGIICETMTEQPRVDTRVRLEQLKRVIFISTFLSIAFYVVGLWLSSTEGSGKWATFCYLLSACSFALPSLLAVTHSQKVHPAAMWTLIGSLMVVGSQILHFAEHFSAVTDSFLFRMVDGWVPTLERLLLFPGMMILVPSVSFSLLHAGRAYTKALAEQWSKDREIKKRIRAEVLLSARATVLSKLADDSPLEEVLSDIVEMTESGIEGSVVSLLSYDEEGDPIRTVVSRKSPEEFKKELEEARDTIRKIGFPQGVSGKASPQIIEDVCAIEKGSGYRNFVRKYAIRSCWTFPVIHSEPSSAGLLLVQFTERRKPTAEELETGRSAAGLAEVVLRQRHVEKALRESEEKHRSLTDDVLDTASEGFVILDRDYRVAWVSEKMLGLFSLSREEVVGLDGRTFVCEKLSGAFEDSDKCVEQILSTYRGQIEEKRFVCHLPGRVNGKEDRWLEYRSQPIKSGLYAGGRIEHYTDITDLKRAEQALLGASRIEATATLAGGVAHDFNNLMVAVMGNAELLREDLNGNPNHTEMLDSIIQAAEKAGYLATQMLHFARGGSFYPRRINLNDVIREILKFRGGIKGSRIDIRFEPAKDLPDVWGDPAQIQEVVNNLLNNSIEAIENDGRITIRTWVSSHENSAESVGCKRFVSLSIRDTGIGMDTETQARVFEPFFTTKFQGRGIGLASAYGIIRNHGGNITVESRVGAGSRFSVHLPAYEPEETEAETGIVPADGTHPRTILIIDDEGSVRRVTQTILEHNGYKVLTASDGVEAIEICKEYDEEIDLTILDMAMPRLDGRETFPILRKERPEMKFLLFSGYEIDTAVRELLAAGAESFLRKPVHSEELIGEIKRILDT